MLWELAHDLGALIPPVFLSSFSWNTLSVQLSIVTQFRCRGNYKAEKIALSCC